MMFARWKSKEACLDEMMVLHPEADAHKIVAGIEARVNSNTLFKSYDENVEIIISKSDESEEIVVYGTCSYEKMDPQLDVVTTEYMASFFKKLFSIVPERYRNCMVDHRNFQGGIPLKKYVHPKTGKEYFTHVHEKGAMLVSMIRPDDGMRITKQFRELIKSGLYGAYSISGRSIRKTTKMIDGLLVKFHHEAEPVEITYCRRGMNDKSVYNVVSKAASDNTLLGDFYTLLDKAEEPEEPEDQEEEPDIEEQESSDEDKGCDEEDHKPMPKSSLSKQQIKDNLEILGLLRKHGIES